MTVTATCDRVHSLREQRAGAGPLLVGLAALGPFSLNAFKPCLPWIRLDLGTSAEVVQLGLSLAILASALAAAGYGLGADRWGRRPVVLGCLAVYVAGSLLAALAPGATLLIAGRVLQAASSSVGLAGARALIHDRHGAGSANVIARVTLVAVLAVVLAPAVSGLLIDRTGWRAVFGLGALVGALLLLIAGRQLGADGDRRRTGPAGGGARGIALLLRSRSFVGFALQSSLHFALFFAFTSAASYIMVERLARDATAYGTWFVGLALTTAAGLASARIVGSRVRPGVLCAVGSAVVCLASLSGAWVLSRPGLTPVGLFLPPAVASFGVGLALPGSNAGVMLAVPRLAGTASALLSFMQLTLAALFAQLAVAGGGWPPRMLIALLVAGGVVSLGASLLSLPEAAEAGP